MPTSLISTSTMSGMSFTTESILDEYFIPSSSSSPQSQTRSRHRSYSLNDFQQIKFQGYECHRPDSSVINDDYLDAHQKYWNESGDDTHDESDDFSTLASQHAVWYGSSSERFSHSTNASTTHADFDVIPTRPSLKPTGSFGGGSGLSYYSSASHELERKSEAIAFEEEAKRRKVKPSPKKWFSRLLHLSTALGKR